MKTKLIAIFLLASLVNQLPAQNTNEAGKFIQEVDSIIYMIKNESDVYQLKQSRTVKIKIRGACVSDNNIKPFKRKLTYKKGVKIEKIDVKSFNGKDFLEITLVNDMLYYAKRRSYFANKSGVKKKYIEVYVGGNLYKQPGKVFYWLRY